MTFNAFTMSEFATGQVGSQVSLGTYATYAEAQRAVDTLADERFEVEMTQIIGSNLRMVEQITGRQTWGRAILAGVAQGAWFGLFVGLVLGLISNTSFLGSLSWGVSWGAVFWGIFAAFDYSRTRGRRDFTSLRITVPTSFEVLVVAEHADRARSILATPAS